MKKAILLTITFLMCFLNLSSQTMYGECIYGFYHDKEGYVQFANKGTWTIDAESFNNGKASIIGKCSDNIYVLDSNALMRLDVEQFNKIPKFSIISLEDNCGSELEKRLILYKDSLYSKASLNSPVIYRHNTFNYTDTDIYKEYRSRFMRPVLIGLISSTLVSIIVLTTNRSSNICGYPTLDGHPCKRYVKGSGYCWQHKY